MSMSTTAPRTFQLPSARVLIGTAYALCVLAPIAMFLAVIAFTDVDPSEPSGPLESIRLIGTIGTAALLLGVGLGSWLIRTEARARVGAIVFGTLALLTVVFFWAGAPGVLGACAAWQAGLTRGGRPLTGAARVAGICGAFVALANVVMTVVGTALGIGG
jgi:hypothetical protein